MKTDDGSACRTTQRMKENERLICSGRSARRTAYRCRFVYGRTYGGEEIDDPRFPSGELDDFQQSWNIEDPAVCLSCREPAWKCEGEYRCYLRHKAMREKPKKKEVSEMLLESWKPSGIYDIWGENLP